MKRIAFIGAGTMGAGMARNLARAGNTVVVHDRDADRLQSLQREGLTIAPRLSDAVSEAEVVITMLPDSSIVRQVIEGPEGVAAHLAPGAIVIDMGTSVPADVRALGALVRSAGGRMIDAPVGRPPRHAEDGTLVIMAGGDDADIREVWPLFEAMGEIIHHVGPLGSGMTLKIINNYMSMVGMLLTAETLTLGSKAGIDRKLLVDVLSTTAAGRGQLIVNYPNKVLAGDITPDFPMTLGLKDIRLALDLGSEVSSPLALGGVTREFFNLGIAAGRGNDDCTAMLLVLEQLAGTDSKPGSAG